MVCVIHVHMWELILQKMRSHGHPHSPPEFRWHLPLTTVEPWGVCCPSFICTSTKMDVGLLEDLKRLNSNIKVLA